MPGIEISSNICCKNTDKTNKYHDMEGKQMLGVWGSADLGQSQVLDQITFESNQISEFRLGGG